MEKEWRLREIEGERGGVATAEDSRNFTQERVQKKNHIAWLTFLWNASNISSESTNVYVCGWVGYTSVCVARWQEGFQHINITLPHKETQASVRAFSGSNKHGSSSTRGVRGSAHTKMEFRQNTALLLTDKWQSSQLRNPMWDGFIYIGGADVANASWAAALRPGAPKAGRNAGGHQGL